MVCSAGMARRAGRSPTKRQPSKRSLPSCWVSSTYSGITSGTAALHTALTALGIGPGDEVILPAWTWYSCYYAILMTGALPVFAEDDDSFAIDPVDLEKKITPQTKAIMVVHLFGSPANMDAVMDIARRHGLKVLEDSAQFAGGQYKGKRTSTIGDIGIFSFQLHKMITAGEGGAVVTNDPLLYERAVRFHDLGLLRPPTQAQVGQGAMPYFMGLNYRMNEMTGAVLLAQVRKLDNILAEQRRRGGYVIERVSRLPGIKMRRSNDWDGELHLTVDLLLASQELRDQFLKAMKAENVPMERPSAAVVLPAQPPIANKAVPHPAWPTFNSPRGKEMRYGAESVPRTMEIFNRTATLTVGPAVYRPRFGRHRRGHHQGVYGTGRLRRQRSRRAGTGHRPISLSHGQLLPNMDLLRRAEG